MAAIAGLQPEVRKDVADRAGQQQRSLERLNAATDARDAAARFVMPVAGWHHGRDFR